MKKIVLFLIIIITFFYYQTSDESKKSFKKEKIEKIKEDIKAKEIKEAHTGSKEVLDEKKPFLKTKLFNLKNKIEELELKICYPKKYSLCYMPKIGYDHELYDKEMTGEYPPTEEEYFEFYGEKCLTQERNCKEFIRYPTQIELLKYQFPEDIILLEKLKNYQEFLLTNPDKYEPFEKYQKEYYQLKIRELDLIDKRMYPKILEY